MPTVSQRTGLDGRTSLLGPRLRPHFDDAFVRSCELYEEYVFRLTCQVFERSGLGVACGSPATVAEAVDRAGLNPRAATVPVRWILGMLAARGRLHVEGSAGEPRYRAIAETGSAEPEEVRRVQERHDPAALPSYEIAALAAEHYPAVLRGETTGERALFGAERMSAWSAYFANTNVIYAISNTVAALAAEPEIRQDPPAVLELGGGLGSGTAALCARLLARGGAVVPIRYHFTELSIPFLRRARNILQSVFPAVTFQFTHLDMNERFADAGVAPDSHALVYSVNALHVARDLAFTLGQIRETLVPGGALVAGECLRPFAGHPIYVEFVFNLLDAFQHPKLVDAWRPNGGFLTPEQWTRALEENGFRDVRVVPDIVALRDHYPSFVVAAIVARRA